MNLTEVLATPTPTAATAPTLPTYPMVTIETLAKYFAVSISTVRSWLRQEYIPKEAYLKIGATYRFDLQKVIDALTKHEDEKKKNTPEQMSLPLDSAPNPDIDL